MKSLDQAIARAQAQLRFIPTRPLRQALLLALLNEHTASGFSFTMRTDELGRNIGGTIYPLSLWRLAKIPELGPTYNILNLMTEEAGRIWNCKPGVAMVVTDEEFYRSLIYEFICRPMDERHIAVLPFSYGADGSLSLVMITRGHADESYTPRDLQTLEKVGAHFVGEFEDVSAGGEYQPRAPRSSEHVCELDAELRPTAMPLYAQALLSLFYGRLPQEAKGGRQLPAELKAAIQHHGQAAFSCYGAPGEDFHHAFTKDYRGRRLCLTVQSVPSGGYRLTCHEDTSKHERLCRLKRVCWNELARDRHTVFHAVLALLDGERDPTVIARRAGIVALKESSKLRIINRARNIVAGL